MRFALHVRLVVRAVGDRVPASEPSLLDRLDAVYDNLVEQEAGHPALRDSDMNATLVTPSHATADVTLTIETTDADEAVAVGLSCLRAAVHHAGIHTPHWAAVPGEAAFTVAATEEAVEATPLAGV